MKKLFIPTKKTVIELKEQFDKAVEPPKKSILSLFSAATQYETYFGNFSKNRFWLSYSKPNQLTSSTLKVLKGDIVVNEQGVYVKLSYKIPLKLKLLILCFCIFNFMLLVLDIVFVDRIYSMLLIFLVTLFHIAGYGIILFSFSLTDYFLCGKEKKEKLIQHVRKYIVE